MRTFGRREAIDALASTAGGEGTAAAAGNAASSPGLRPAARPAAAEALPQYITLLRERVLRQIDPSLAADLSASDLRRQIEQVVHQIADEQRIEVSAREQLRIAGELADDMTGYGPLQPLLNDDEVTDIMVNGPFCVFVERKGRLQQTDVRFRDAEHVLSTGQKIAAVVGRRIDESSPMVDARLSDGSRVNIIFPPLALDGACISIRKFARQRLDFNGLVSNGSMSASVARMLGIAARCRLNVLISGGTGSGKTTLLNAMSRLVDEGERIVTIEDAAELQLQQPHVVRLETRPSNIEGTGEVTQRDLLRNALRMRPDRIIVGEVRGAEAFDMLQAMNTGHDGSISTIHANNSRDAVVRVENMVQMGNMNLPVSAIRTQIVSALDLIVQVERMRDGQRRVTQVSEVVGLEGDVITMNDLAVFEFEKEDSHGRIVGRYRNSMNRPRFLPRLEYFGMDRAWLQAEQA
jgi:pilus assembly protein CpaF